MGWDGMVKDGIIWNQSLLHILFEPFEHTHKPSAEKHKDDGTGFKGTRNIKQQKGGAQ